MLLRQLEYLVALARERHFARAAAACYVSQPSLSAAIRRLEHELDVPIVRRGRRYEGLTPEGEVVLAWAHRILAEQDALHQELSALRGGLTGTLRLGVVPTALPAASSSPLRSVNGIPGHGSPWSRSRPSTSPTGSPSSSSTRR